MFSTKRPFKLNNSSLRRLFTLIVVAMGLLASEAKALDFLFMPFGPPNLFESSINWSSIGPPGIGPPGVNDTAVFNNPGAYAVSFFTSPMNQNFNVNAGDVTFQPLDVANPNHRTYTLLNQFSSIDGGNLTLKGTGDDTFRLSPFVLLVGEAGNGSVTVQNGASVVIDVSVFIGDDAGSSGQVTVDGPDAIWTSEFFTIVGRSGNGTLLIQNGGRMTNQNAEIADFPGSTGQATVQGPGSMWTTSNRLEVAENGDGMLLIQNGGNVSSTDGVIGVDAGSTGAVTIDGAGSRWDVAGNLTVGGRGFGLLTLTDQGEVAIEGQVFANQFAQIQLFGGKLTAPTLSSEAIAALNWQSGTLNLTDPAGLTVGASGLLGDSLALNGAQSLELGGTLTIESGSSFVGGAELTATSIAVQPGSNFALVGTEVTSPAGSDITVLGNVTFNDLVSGAGGFFGPGTAIFNGGHSPGDSPAVVPVEANLEYGDTNTLTIELGGLLDGQFDRIDIEGDATLKGNLVIDLLTGFRPSLGDQFEFLDVAGTLSGQFLGLDEGDFLTAITGQPFQISYAGGDGNDVLLTAGLAGDFDADGDVDGNDFLFWQRGESFDPLSASDLAAWEANYSTIAPLAATSTAVPEPGTCLLVCFALIGFVGGYRKRWLGISQTAVLAILLTTINASTVDADLVLEPGVTVAAPADTQWSGAIKNNGTIVGPTGADEFLTFTGHVSGAGSFLGNVEFVNNFSPGNSPAVVPVEGNLGYGPANTLTIELGGLLEGEFDRLVVGGNVSLDGFLNVELINSFSPSAGNSFEIIDVGGTQSGQFIGLGEGSPLGNFGGTELFISYAGGGNNVVITTTASTVPEPAWIGGLGVGLASLYGWWTSSAGCCRSKCIGTPQSAANGPS